MTSPHLAVAVSFKKSGGVVDSVALVKWLARLGLIVLFIGCAVACGDFPPSGSYMQDGIAHAAAIRLDASLALQASSAYVGTYENNRRIEPTVARPASLRSELIVAGSSAGVHEGLILRLRPDVSIAFSSFPTFGPGASEISVIHSIAELPLAVSVTP